jgi:hypothetical protein
MSNTKGPVALFSSTEHPEANLVDYISYGAGGQTNESKAIAKGIWSADTFITNIEEGQSIALIEGSWVAGTPTPGQFNISYTEPHDEELPDENPQDKTQDENLPEISEQTTTRVKPTTPTTGGSNTTMNDLRLLINEFVSDPDDGDDEWIELYNPNGRSVMLTDWSIIEGGGRETIFSTTIPANGFHSIERPKGRLNNTGDTILLQNDNFDIVDSVTYGSWDDGNINDNAPNASNPDSVARRTDGLDSDLDIDDFIRTAPTKNAPNKTLSIKTPLLEKIIPENKKIEIEKENRSPVAQFTSPDIALNNNSIIFDASDSGDLDNDSLTYIWNFGNNDGMSGRIADYHYPHAGDYTVSLMVSDGKLTSVSEKIITVVDDPKLLPLIVDDIILQKLIRISEVLPNPTGNDADGEWVEIQNLSNQTIDLSSWELDDKEGGSKPYTLPEWALIEPQSFLLIEREESRLAFNNTVDEVRLFSPDKKLVDEISYASVKFQITNGIGMTLRHREQLIKKYLLTIMKSLLILLLKQTILLFLMEQS